MARISNFVRESFSSLSSVLDLVVQNAVCRTRKNFFDLTLLYIFTIKLKIASQDVRSLRGRFICAEGSNFIRVELNVSTS
jgi:hypothetical protein